ncbi:MAG: hypothetical protein COA84_04470 [Robiginitomaculum sp.]|nr:MAG: hypothetical protein COA84_04470 [Robiginitomaculum sp.]
MQKVFISTLGLLFLLASTDLVMANTQLKGAQAPPKTAQRTIELSDAQLEILRQREVALAAKLYTDIAFSPQNMRKMREGLPLSEASFQAALKTLRLRFSACMESGFEARLDNALSAQILRKTIQSTQSASVSEPKKARSVMPAFKATDAYCAGRIQAWLASAIE